MISYTGGRSGDAAANTLAERLKELELPRGRLKTGTPPRLDGNSIDFSKLEKQQGDSDPIPTFSFMQRPQEPPQQLPCWLTDRKSTRLNSSHVATSYAV